MSAEESGSKEAEQKLRSELDSLQSKLGDYQKVTEDPKDIACSACPPQKLAYEICMQKWYNGVFLKGNAGTTLPCAPEYKVYNKCVKVRDSPFLCFCAICVCS